MQDKQKRRGVLAELNKLKGMSIRKKVEYIWDYYHYHFVGLIVVTLFLFYIGDVIYQSTFDIALQGFFTNDDMNLFDAKDITKNFSEFIELDMKQRIVFDDSLYIELDSSTDYVAASQGKITAYMTAKELDFIVTNQELTDHYISLIQLSDLESILPDDINKQLSEFFYYQEGVDGLEKAYAIDLSKSRFMKNSEYEGTKPFYLMIPTSAPHHEMLNTFLKYAFYLN